MTSTSGSDFLQKDNNEGNEESNSDTKTETKTLDLYDANKGVLKRDGGPYLDQVERESAEIIRAQKEGREPDLENPPATAGTYLVPKHYLRETDASNSHTSAAAQQENEPEATVNVEVPAETKPDERQADWDNDHQKVQAINQKATYNDNVDKDLSEKQDKPVSEDAPSQPDASKNNENVVTGVANNSWTPPGSPNAPVADKKSEVKDNKDNG